jgi:hypothetical protein
MLFRTVSSGLYVERIRGPAAVGSALRRVLRVWVSAFAVVAAAWVSVLVASDAPRAGGRLFDDETG